MEFCLPEKFRRGWFVPWESAVAAKGKKVSIRVNSRPFAVLCLAAVEIRGCYPASIHGWI